MKQIPLQPFYQRKIAWYFWHWPSDIVCFHCQYPQLLEGFFSAKEALFSFYLAWIDLDLGLHMLTVVALFISFIYPTKSRSFYIQPFSLSSQPQPYIMTVSQCCLKQEKTKTCTQTNNGKSTVSMMAVVVVVCEACLLLSLVTIRFWVKKENWFLSSLNYQYI